MQTLKDKSLLFVDAGYHDDTVLPDEAKTVRLSAQHANDIPLAVAVGIEEVITLADRDGVFRGSPGAVLPRRGQPAPPMQLGRSN